MSWSAFVREHWERRGTILRGADAALLPQLSADALFAAVVATCDAFRRGAPERVRFYAGRDVVALDGDGGEVLPLSFDGSFLGYHARVTRTYGVPDYALVVADWHAHARTAWEQLAGAVGQLAREVGVSGTRMDTQMFLGTYRGTPFGVHDDPVSAFHVPIVGPKTMRFWSPEIVDANPALRRARDYRAYLEPSRALTAEPGEVLYWPSRDWHIGESDGRFSAAWGLGYWTGRAPHLDDPRRWLAHASALGFLRVPRAPQSALLTR